MRIFHLEDDGPLREVLKIMITSVSPSDELHQFGDSDSAVRFLDSKTIQFDLFILDIRVPGKLDGLGVAEKIRELDYAGMMVITSAFRKPEQGLLERLKCKWYAKPWHLTQIQDILIATNQNSTQAILKNMNRNLL
jgi:DNA-binding response OmpR family regulator